MCRFFLCLTVSTRTGALGERVIAVTSKSDDTTTVNLEKARQFGRVSEDGHVFVIVEGEEYAVGQLPDASEEEALAYFARKFESVEAQVSLLESRVLHGAPSADLQKSVEQLGAQVAVRNMVGDYANLQERLITITGQIAELAETEKQAQSAAREAALAARENIVREAETIAGQDPEKTHWKNSHTRMNELFELWKTTQREHHLPKSIEDDFWKRFRTARTTFDKHRRAHFSSLDEANAQAKRAKEALIAEAEELATSTDWAATAGKYRSLMDRWKAAPRASRKEDDALWARFRAAQDKFFAARKAANAQLDKEYEANLAVKEDLLKQARALLPVKNIKEAKKQLDSILDRWDAAGRVPRQDMRRIEGELKKVQDAIHQAENAKWTKTDPEKKARANSMLTQLEETIASLEEDLAQAQASGDAKKIAQAQEALTARRQWLSTLQQSSADFTA